MTGFSKTQIEDYAIKSARSLSATNMVPTRSEINHQLNMDLRVLDEFLRNAKALIITRGFRLTAKKQLKLMKMSN